MTNYTEIITADVRRQSHFIEIQLHFSEYVDLKTNYGGEVDITLLLSEQEAKRIKDYLKVLVEGLENSLG